MDEISLGLTIEESSPRAAEINSNVCVAAALQAAEKANEGINETSTPDAYVRAQHEFPRLASDMPAEQFWRTVHRLWTYFNDVDHVTYADLFRRHQNGWCREYMLDENAAAYDCLPDYVDVFRGQNLKRPLGLAWSLNEGVALYDFAMNVKGCGEECIPGVVCARVPKKSIAGIFLRDCETNVTNQYENEVVLFEPPVRRYSYEFESVPWEVETEWEGQRVTEEEVLALMSKHPGLTAEGARELIRLLNPTISEQAATLVRRRPSLSFDAAYDLVCRRRRRAALRVL